MTDAERITFLLDIMAKIGECASNGMRADSERHWQYLEEINSNAAYSLRKAGEKDNGQPR